MVKIAGSIEKPSTPIGAFTIHSGNVDIALKPHNAPGDELKDLSSCQPNLTADYICFVPEVPTIFKKHYAQRDQDAPDYCCMGEFTKVYFKGTDVTALFFNVDEGPLMNDLYENYPEHLFSGKYGLGNRSEPLPTTIEELSVNMSFNALCGYHTKTPGTKSYNEWKTVDEIQVKLHAKVVKIRSSDASPMADDLYGFVVEQAWINGQPVFGNNKVFTSEYQYNLWHKVLLHGMERPKFIYEAAETRQATIPSQVERLELNLTKIDLGFSMWMPIPEYADPMKKVSTTNSLTPKTK